MDLLYLDRSESCITTLTTALLESDDMLNLLGLTDFHTFPKTCENTLRETVLTVKALSVPSWHSITTAICCLETRTVFLFPWWLLRLFLVSFYSTGFGCRVPKYI